ncbi:MAG: hypothetical protein IPL86_08275 [Flavobacteriales bacterium]|nr:hypothetical protein [Flavobacteriales bacterium]
MANPTPPFNRVAFIVLVAAALLLYTYFAQALPIAGIAFWVFGYDTIRVSVGWNWSRSAAKPSVPEELKRLLVQDLAGWKILGAFLAMLLFWLLRKVPVDVPRLVVFVAGLSVVSGAIREWRLRSVEQAPRAKAIGFVLMFWALYSAASQTGAALQPVDLFGYLFHYWLMIPLGLLGVYAMYQAVRQHLVRSEVLMDADD